MVPLMITSAISYLINRSKNKYSIYTKPLAEKGELLSHEDKDSTVLNMMKLRYLVENDYLVLSKGDQLNTRMPEVLHSKRNIFPVLDDHSAFIGLIYVEDILRNSYTDGQNLGIAELIQPAPYTILPDTNVKAVLEIMEKESLWVLPVVDAEDHYLGFVSKTNIFNKYRALLTRQADYME